MPIIDVTEELMQNETAEEEVEWDKLEEKDQSMQEEQFDYRERRDRSRSPRERREIKEDVQEGTRSTWGIRPLRYREM